MKLALNGTGVAALGALVVGVGVVGYLAYKLLPKLKTLATQTLNPASSENIVNQGVTAAVSGVTGYDESLGGAVADKVFQWRHPDFKLSGATQPKVKATVSPNAAITLDPFSNPLPTTGGPAPYTVTTDGDAYTGTEQLNQVY